MKNIDKDVKFSNANMLRKISNIRIANSPGFQISIEEIRKQMAKKDDSKK